MPFAAPPAVQKGPMKYISFECIPVLQEGYAGQAVADCDEAAFFFAGFGRFQWLMLLYTGLAWCADAMEMMLLSFLGPAVSFCSHVHAELPLAALVADIAPRPLPCARCVKLHFTKGLGLLWFKAHTLLKTVPT